MSIGYVVAAYFGARRADDPRMVADKTYYLRRHLAALERNGSALDQIVIVVSGDVPQAAESLLLAARAADDRIVVLQRENGGMSYGAWSHAFKTLGGDRHDYWIISEDDYAPAREGFDVELLKLIQWYGPRCGFVCGSAGDDGDGKRHAQVFLGILRGTAVASVLDKLIVPPGSKYFDSELQGQIGWSRTLIDAGWTIEDWSTQWGSPFWDYMGLQWLGARRAALFVPLQCVGTPVQLENGAGLARVTADGACLPGPATLCVIIPSLGAPTLGRTLASIQRQRLIQGDQVILMQDGASDGAQRAFESFSGTLPIETHVHEDHAWGNPQRNWAIENAAKAEYLVWMDEDDAFTDVAFDAIRSAIAVTPGRPLMFRFKTPGGEILWKTKKLQQDRIGGHEFVTPNLDGLVGRWGRGYAGDYEMIESTLAKWPKDALVWREEVIAVCRPVDPFADRREAIFDSVLKVDDEIQRRPPADLIHVRKCDHVEVDSPWGECQDCERRRLSGRPTIGIVIYTRARPTFGRCLESIAAQQCIEGDEVYVVAHGIQGPCESAYGQIRQKGLPPGRYEEIRTHDLEWEIGDEGLRMATTEYVMVLEETDVLSKGAMAEIRKTLEANRGRSVLLQKKHRTGVTDRVALGLNIPGQVGSYRNFTSTVIGRALKPPVVVDSVIVDVKPFQKRG